jgi:hypothetical protein
MILLTPQGKIGRRHWQPESMYYCNVINPPAPPHGPGASWGAFGKIGTQITAGITVSVYADGRWWWGSDGGTGHPALAQEALLPGSFVSFYVRALREVITSH